MKILITGAAGFIGSALVRQMIAETDVRIVGVDKLTYAGNLNSLADARHDPRFVLEKVDICPWAVREGVIAHRMATMPVLATDDLHDLLDLRPDVTEIPEPDEAPDSPTAAEAEELTARHL